MLTQIKLIFILWISSCFSLGVNAQDGKEQVSNNWYFSQSDTLFFSQKHFASNNIRQVKEYRTDQKYADSTQLMGVYTFDTAGSIIESKTFDIHGASSVTKFVIASNGKLSQSWVTDKNGILKKSREYFYDGHKLIKQISYFSSDYKPSIEYTYSTNDLIAKIQYFGPNGEKGAITALAYDSLNRLVSKVTEDAYDSIKLSYYYKYDSLGRKFITEYRETNLVWTETIDYSKSTSKVLREKIYLDGKLTERRTKKTDKRGFIKELIIDRRRNFKSRHRRPSRYTKCVYKYDSNGRLIYEIEFYSPNKFGKRTRTEYSYDNMGNLIYKVIFKNGKKDSEWSYLYN